MHLQTVFCVFRVVNSVFSEVRPPPHPTPPTYPHTHTHTSPRAPTPCRPLPPRLLPPQRPRLWYSSPLLTTRQRHPATPSTPRVGGCPSKSRGSCRCCRCKAQRRSPGGIKRPPQVSCPTAVPPCFTPMGATPLVLRAPPHPTPPCPPFSSRRLLRELPRAGGQVPPAGHDD